jgi:hypothetical protein
MRAEQAQRVRTCGTVAPQTYQPGDIINAKVTVRQGREDGFWYELPFPITVQRPTDPSLTIYDEVKLLKPVDDVRHRAGDRVQLRLEIVSLHSVGRPNPADGGTTVNVREFKGRCCC